MPRTVKAQQGDTLDLVCWRELGTTAGGTVENALTLNPNLNSLSELLPEGIEILLPDPPAAAVADLATVNLWD